MEIGLSECLVDVGTVNRVSIYLCDIESVQARPQTSMDVAKRHRDVG